MSANGIDPSDRESSSESDGSRKSEIARPNRWQGPASTWKSLTSADRGVATSLDTLRDRDLSVHLFNAHSLKRKAREFEEAENSGINIPLLEDTRGFLPPKVWTAWPLPTEDVPRIGEDVGSEDPLEIHTLRIRETPWPGRELEEALMAVTLKHAKVMFRSRESEEGKIDRDPQGRSPHSSPARDSDEDTSEDSRDPSPSSQRALEDDTSSGASQLGSDAASLRDKAPKIKPNLIPALSTDDARSSIILQPSIRSTLSKLDDILMALHHARETCHRYTKSDAGTDEDGNSISVASIASEDMVMAGKKARGRPRKLASQTNLREPTPSQLLRAKKTHAGRPKKDYPRLENETSQEYIIRIARLQKKPLPSFAPPVAPPSPRSKIPPPQARKEPIKTSTEEELAITRKKRLNLRDWSEVLGAAALVGFDQNVIERATVRCAALFGEGMTMRTLIETPFAEPKDFMSTYDPALIPEYEIEEFLNTSPTRASSNEQSSISSARPYRMASRPKSTKKPSTTLPRCCSVTGCPRSTKSFRDQYSLKRHLRLVHGIFEVVIQSTEGSEESEQDSLPSDEEMEGGVHVDGFLKPQESLVKPPRKNNRKDEDSVWNRNQGRRAATKNAKKSTIAQVESESGSEDEADSLGGSIFSSDG